MKKHRSITIMFLLLIVSASPVAAGDGWSLSSWNPFKKASTPKRAHASVSDQATRQSAFPQMSLPSWKTQSRSPKQQSEPSTFAKLNQGTQDLFGKAKDMLTPWNANSKRKSSASKGRSSSKGWFFTSWLPQKKQPKKDSRTVKDFLAQPRPGF